MMKAVQLITDGSRPEQDRCDTLARAAARSAAQASEETVSSIYERIGMLLNRVSAMFPACTSLTLKFRC